jgi:phage shock protein PspC (stress-responsive transcriptional regulator)
MKKTITINLAGIVFHIEEDAYEVLQAYLNSVKNYFLKVEGGADIQGDIESRIAEIFSGFINDFKQAIAIEDVETVIRQMGTVEDMMGDEAEFVGEESKSSEQGQSGTNQEFSGTRRLLRDSSNALIAGVCSGIAAYFGTNPLWIRLGTLTLFFGFFIFKPLSGSMVLAYIILWIAMPAQANLENKGNFKKFFRSRKDKVLGGVAGGIGRFFGIDPAIVRVLFVLLIFAGGGGVLVYILFWAITPEAKSVTDEIQMEGNPITLNTIEDQIKKNVKLDNKETENTLIKILVFPFKLLSLVLAALGPFLLFIFEAIRLFVAVILFIIGGVLLFGVVVLVLAGLGWMEGFESNIQFFDFPIARAVQEITPWMIGFGGLAFFIPVFALLLFSLSLMFKRFLIKPIVGLVLVGLFLVGGIGFGVSVLPLVKNFSSEGNHTVKKEFTSGFQTMALNINLMDRRMNEIHPVKLKIRGWEGKNIMLAERFEAQGRNWQDAGNNARLALYNVVQQDSSLIFDSNLSLDPGISYRAQRLDMTLFVPMGQKFTIDKNFDGILEHTLHLNGYNVSQLEGNTWMFVKSGIVCVTCPDQPKQNSEEYEEIPDTLNTGPDDNNDWD